MKSDSSNGDTKSPGAGRQDSIPWWNNIHTSFFHINAFVKNNARITILILIVILFFLVGMAYMAPVHRWGDASTYYMQISSIANDRDIQYLPEDIQRAMENRFDDLPAGLFLTRTNDGEYYYSKEFSFALFAAPFYKILGISGILVFNAVLFWLMILMGYLHLRKKNPETIALMTSVAFFTLSAAFVYIFWIHTEIYNMFLIAAGLFVWLLYYEKNDYRYLLLASFIFGIAAVAKIPNIAVFIPLIFFEIYNKRPAHLAGMILLFLIPLIAFTGFWYSQTGYIDVYGGERIYFTDKYPYLLDYDDTEKIGTYGFSVGDESRLVQTVLKAPGYLSPDNLKNTLHILMNYLFGRFTGMIWYYPYTLFAVASLASLFIISCKTGLSWGKISNHIGKYQERYLILLGICLTIAGFIILHPNNYFGGEHAIGNRYFYIYPAFLFLIGTVDLKKMIPFLLIAFLFVVPIITDPIQSSKYPATHTERFPFTYTPMEYSQINSLPLWGDRHSFNTFTIYQLDDQSSPYQGGFLVDNGTAEFLIQQKDRTDTVEMIILPYRDPFDTCLTFHSNGETLLLNTTYGSVLDVSHMTEVYSDHRYSLYRFGISSGKAALTLPIQPIDDEPLNLSLIGDHIDGDWDGRPTRWISESATLFITSDVDQEVFVFLNAKSLYRPTLMKIYVNDIMEYQTTLSTEFSSI
ncbi:hypothetical protein D5R95_02025, partial [Methanosalsum natronophilum]